MNLFVKTETSRSACSRVIVNVCAGIIRKRKRNSPSRSNSTPNFAGFCSCPTRTGMEIRCFIREENSTPDGLDRTALFVSQFSCHPKNGVHSEIQLAQFHPTHSSVNPLPGGGRRN